MTGIGLIVWRVLWDLSDGGNAVSARLVKVNARAVGCHSQGISNRLSELCRHGVVKRVAPGMYAPLAPPVDEHGHRAPPILVQKVMEPPPIRFNNGAGRPEILRDENGELIVPAGYVERYDEPKLRRCWCRVEYFTDLISEDQCPAHGGRKAA